jgi:Prokaryotic dksA/traR C4-type zinc finger
MKSSEVLRLERYLKFHLAVILEQLDGNPKADSGTDFLGSGKPGNSTPVLKKCLLRSRKQIHSALARIQEGTYGNCLQCGNEISLRHLEVIPWTQFCSGCEKEFELYQEESTSLIGPKPKQQVGTKQTATGAPALDRRTND